MTTTTELRDALLAKLTSDWDFDPYGEHEAAVMRLRADLDALIAAARLAGWEAGHDCECDAALARSNEQSAYADLAEAQRRELDLAARLDAAVEARAALTPERLAVPSGRGLAECAYWYFLMTQQGGPDGSELDAAVTEDMLYALRDWAATNPDPDYLAALATDEAVP